MPISHRLFVPKQAVGANLVYFDMFNNSDKEITVFHVQPIVSGAVAVVGTLGVDLFLTYTSAVGTGGTAATYGGTDTTAMTFCKTNPRMENVPDTVTARLTPAGGATAAGVISWTSVFTEETSSSAYMGKLTDLLWEGEDAVIIPKGFGIRVVQGAVASVGNIGFDVCFRI